jgi:Zn-dependent protease with chaperone function
MANRMALTQEEFENSIEVLEAYADRQPHKFRQRVFWLATMGYGYLLFVVSLLVWSIFTIPSLPTNSLPYGSMWLGCLLLIAIILLGIIVRSLWVNSHKPEGQKLRHDEAPQLFELINELATTLDVPKFHRILITNELNAAVYQRPLLGIFGWFQNYLLIGLPLMEALTVEQFRAVLGHEFGHLSGKHSQFANWIYRIHQVWVQLLEKLHKHHQRSRAGSGIWYIDTLMLVTNGFGFLIFGWFFEWFVAKFTAYSFVLSRINEYVADKYAANWMGGQHLAAGLISIYIKERYLKQVFWREIYQQADLDPQPPNAIPLMFKALKTQLPRDRQVKWLQAALAEKTDTTDTHPCLSERLHALGYLDRASELLDDLAIAKSAAEEILSQDLLVKITARENELWQTNNQGFWKSRTNYLQYLTPQLLALEQKAKTQTLTFDEKWDLCRWTSEIKGGDLAMPLLHDLLIERSYYAPANHLLGKILLDKQDESGIDYLESAVSCDVELTVDSYQLICDFLDRELGDTDKVKYFQSGIEQYYYRNYW